MNSATGRGCLVFIGLVVFLAACAVLTFGVLPGAGAGAFLPVIVVPAEPYKEGWPSEGFMWTNTLTMTVLASLVVLLFAFFARRVSNAWTKEVPGRFQGIVELLGDFMYGQTRNFAGTRQLARNWLFPLAASIFLFLLVANWMKLLPGVESVGVMHCAGHVNPALGFSVTTGRPTLGSQLWVPAALASGYEASEDDYHACEQYKEGHVTTPSQEQLATAAAELRSEEETLLAELDTQVEVGAITAEARDQQVQDLRLEATESVWEHASVPLSADEIELGVVPYIQVVTPYLRGATTDLNLPLGLALITFVAIQAFGVAAQGPNYFQKFVNLDALGKLGKKPMGAIDFVVGLLEIISEIGKIISLTFRLFGNLFAGGILLAVMSFLVAFILPIIFLGLEVIVTTIQAFVFAVLTIVFSAQAMEGHHGEDEHHDEHAHDEDGHAAEPVKQDIPLDRTAI